MANLADADVTINDSWSEMFQGKRVKARQVTATLDTMGSDTNYISASNFKLTTILRVSPLIKSSDDIILVAAPNYAGTKILLKAAGTNAPADFSGTFKFTVWGQ